MSDTDEPRFDARIMPDRAALNSLFERGVLLPLGAESSEETIAASQKLLHAWAQIVTAFQIETGLIVVAFGYTISNIEVVQGEHEIIGSHSLSLARAPNAQVM